jgi:hypothetical protein
MKAPALLHDAVPRLPMSRCYVPISYGSRLIHTLQPISAKNACTSPQKPGHKALASKICAVSGCISVFWCFGMKCAMRLANRKLAFRLGFIANAMSERNCDEG